MLFQSKQTSVPIFLQNEITSWLWKLCFSLTYHENISLMSLVCPHTLKIWFIYWKCLMGHNSQAVMAVARHVCECMWPRSAWTHQQQNSHSHWFYCLVPLFQKATLSLPWKYLDVRKGGRKIYLETHNPLVTNTGIPERFWFYAPWVFQVMGEERRGHKNLCFAALVDILDLLLNGHLFNYYWFLTKQVDLGIYLKNKRWNLYRYLYHSKLKVSSI